MIEREIEKEFWVQERNGFDMPTQVPLKPTGRWMLVRDKKGFEWSQWHLYIEHECSYSTECDWIFEDFITYHETERVIYGERTDNATTETDTA